MLWWTWICGGRRKARKLLLHPTLSTNEDRPSKLAATEAENMSGTWQRVWKRLAHGWTVVVAQKRICGTGFRRATLCSLRKRPSSVTLRFQSASAYPHFNLLVYLRCFMVQENMLSHKVCSNRCVHGSWENFDVFCLFEDDQMRAGLIT